MYEEPAPSRPNPVPSLGRRHTPFVTYILLAITILVYLLQILAETLLGYDIPALFGMKINEAILAGQFWRFLTPMFLHSSPIHLGFNMYALISIGSGLERYFGRGRYLLLYLLGSFGGNALSFVLSPNRSLGASTSIFGLLAAEGVFLYRHRDLIGSQARAALQNVVAIAGINLLIGLQPGIDNWGHLGGLFSGLIFAWFGGPKLVIEGFFPSQRLIDKHEHRDTLLGSALVLLLFGALAWLRWIV